MQLNDELVLLHGLGETWTYLDPNNIPQTITWDDKITRLGQKKDHYITKRLSPELATELAEKVKSGANDKELMEFIGAGLYSVNLAVKHLKSIGLLPQQMRNRWSRKKRKPRTGGKRLIACVKLRG